MENIRSSPRLDAIADLVPAGCCLADIGTDHGYLPIKLLREGRIKSAVASDLRPGPLSAARNNVERSGVTGIRFCLCDGLEGISPEEADTIVIAGMGGETIVRILENAPWVRREKTLLLQPMTKPEILRKALEEMELRIQRERLVLDSGRIYSVLLVIPGTPEKHTLAEYYTGRAALIEHEKLFEPFLLQWENKLDKALGGLSLAEDARHCARAEELRLLREEIRSMRENHGKNI